MGHEHSTQLHIFLISHQIFWTTCDLGNSVDVCLSCRNPVVLQFNFWVAKPHTHQHRIPSQHHQCFCRRVFSQEGYQWNQWKDLKQVRKYACDSTSPRRSWSHISTNSQRSRPKAFCLWYFQVALWRYHARSSCASPPRNSSVFSHRIDALPTL